ncbi:MAG: BON domain-containing protein [Acidobacteriia bacterium]|nr:BON domain-containing protein [Terriglobia bacterium]
MATAIESRASAASRFGLNFWKATCIHSPSGVYQRKEKRLMYQDSPREASMLRRRIPLTIAVLSGMLLLGGCSYLQTLQKPDDQAITSEIQGKLFADSVLKTRDIHVSSQGGVVTLTGTVNTDLEKAAAERIAGEGKGVKHVLNQLTVGPAAAAPVEPMTAAQPQATPPPEPARVERAKPARHRERASSSTNEAAQASEPETPSAPAAAPPAQPAPMAAAEPAPAPPVRQPVQVTIPAGSTITVRMIDGIDSARNRPRPMKAHGDSSGERSEQNESHGGSDSPAPQEGVLCMDISTRGLAHKRGAAETPPLELPEGPASLSSLCEVAYEDTRFHSLSLYHHWVQASRHCDGFHSAGICDATSERPSARVSDREEMLVSGFMIAATR